MRAERRAVAVLLLMLLGACTEPAPAFVAPQPELASLADAARETITAARSQLDAAADAARPEAVAELGMLYHAHGLGDAADACYAYVEAARPDELRWGYYRAVLARERGDVDAALATIERLISRLDPVQRLAGRVARVELLLDSGRTADAADAVGEIHSEHPVVLVLRARVLISVQPPRWADAIPLLRRALPALTSVREVHYLLGRALSATGLVEEARTELELASGLPSLGLRVPDPWMQHITGLSAAPTVHRQRGNDAFARGDFATAATEFRRALDVDPDDPVTHTNLGSALRRLGDEADATRHYERALQLDPEYVPALVNLGIVRASAGDDETAIQLYERALIGEPTQRVARFNLANARARSGDYGGAEQDYRHLLELDPANGPTRVACAWMLSLLGRDAAAVEVLEAAGDAVDRSTLARLLAASPDATVRDPERALALLSDAMDLTSVETRAMALAAAGRLEEAERLQNDALRAAQEARHGVWVDRLQRRLAVYARGEACLVPWYPDEVAPQAVR